jgi:hypothetical protein
LLVISATVRGLNNLTPSNSPRRKRNWLNRWQSAAGDTKWGGMVASFTPGGLATAGSPELIVVQPFQIRGRHPGYEG